MAEESPAARFMRALHELVTGTDSLQERLSAAWVELMPLKQEDVPDQMRASFEVIEAEMLAAPEDPASLSDDAASAAAEHILLLAAQLWRVE